MEEEEVKNENQAVDSELKTALSNELSSYMNPHSTPVVPEQKVLPTESAVNNILPKPPIPQNIEVKGKLNAIVRTYKGDMEDVIQNNHMSSINIAIAENKRMLERVQTAEVEKVVKKKNYIILIVSILLIVGGVSAFVVPYLLVNKKFDKEKPPEIIYTAVPIVTETEEKINLNDIVSDKIESILANRVDTSKIKLGTIKNIFLTDGAGDIEKPIDAQKFVSLVKLNLPAEIQRTLKPDYMFGAHSFNGNQPFLILKVGSYENAFSGMLKWEIDLWNDFKNLFPLASVDLSTSQSDPTRGFNDSLFKGATYSNKDARVILNSSGSVIFLYSIIDKNTIVFTTSVDTLKEIIKRNTKSKTIAQ